MLSEKDISNDSAFEIKLGTIMYVQHQLQRAGRREILAMARQYNQSVSFRFSERTYYKTS